MYMQHALKVLDVEEVYRRLEHKKGIIEVISSLAKPFIVFLYYRFG